MRTATIALKVRPANNTAKAPNFNRLAPFYRWMEWLTFGPFLWKCRIAFLREMRRRRSALFLGDGDGRFTAQLLKDNPHINVEAVDASEAMLRSLLHRAGPDAVRVRTQIADVRHLNLRAAANFDLVVTHFFLDCLTTEEIATLAGKLRTKMTPGGAWIVSEFATPDNLYGRLIAAPLVSALYLAFSFLTGLTIRRLPNHRQALRHAGFVLSNQHKWLGGLLVSEMWNPAQVAISLAPESRP